MCTEVLVPLHTPVFLWVTAFVLTTHSTHTGFPWREIQSRKEMQQTLVHLPQWWGEGLPWLPVPTAQVWLWLYKFTCVAFNNFILWEKQGTYPEDPSLISVGGWVRKPQRSFPWALPWSGDYTCSHGEIQWVGVYCGDIPTHLCTPATTTGPQNHEASRVGRDPESLCGPNFHGKGILDKII